MTRRMVFTRPLRHAQTCGATRYTTGIPQPLQLPRHPEVEIRRIGQDRERRACVARAAATNCRNRRQIRGICRHHFDDSHHRQILRPDDRLDARLAQVRPRASEELALGPAAAQFARPVRRRNNRRRLLRPIPEWSAAQDNGNLQSNRRSSPRLVTIVAIRTALNPTHDAI